jgi:hypothetical protein
MGKFNLQFGTSDFLLGFREHRVKTHKIYDPVLSPLTIEGRTRGPIIYNMVINSPIPFDKMATLYEHDLNSIPPAIFYNDEQYFGFTDDSLFFKVLITLPEYAALINPEKLIFIAAVIDMINFLYPGRFKRVAIGGSRRHRRHTRRMRGGSMPLSYFTDAPRVGSVEPTGVGYGSSSFSDSGWIRAPINQTGGSQNSVLRGASRYRSRQPFARYSHKGASRYRSRQPFARYSHKGASRYRSRQPFARYSHKGASRYRSRHPPAWNAIGGRYRSHTSQNSVLHKGGFSPSIMGSFASNGLRLLPLAGYVGYNQFKNFSKTKRSTRRSSRSKRSSK